MKIVVVCEKGRHWWHNLHIEAIMSDQFTSKYENLLEGKYECVDRGVLNAWLPGCRQQRRQSQ